MRKNLTVQEYVDQYFRDCRSCDQWQLIGWIVLIVLLISLNFALLGAIIEYVIISA
ncbi:MAG: hypothetical protein KC587_12045 [Nitrospira sp.]|nr:hypothetical protein [Nitrospira sp.]